MPAATHKADRPRILVTGFSVFPGAPVNPTEGLMAALSADPPDCGEGAFRAEVLAVDYGTIGDRLSAIGAAFSPDIAIHFGLARACRGFRLERLARNSHAGAMPDNEGNLPAAPTICDGPATFVSTLPLDAIAAALKARHLPVEWSDDAGAYLCNTVFALSRGHACKGLSPAMSGFIHVPPLAGTQMPGEASMSPADLEHGARAIIATCHQRWNAAFR